MMPSSHPQHPGGQYEQDHRGTRAGSEDTIVTMHIRVNNTFVRGLAITDAQGCDILIGPVLGQGCPSVENVTIAGGIIGVDPNGNRSARAGPSWGPSSPLAVGPSAGHHLHARRRDA